MKTYFSLVLITLLFFQTATSQETNYQELTQIIIGENYNDDDVKIVKDIISTSKKKRTILKFPKMERYLNSNVSIKDFEITKSCADSYTEKINNKENLDLLSFGITQLRKKYENKKPSNNDIEKLNLKIKNYNNLNAQYNQSIDNLKMCLRTHKEILNNHEDLKEDLYNAYLLRKNSSVVVDKD